MPEAGTDDRRRAAMARLKASRAAREAAAKRHALSMGATTEPTIKSPR